MSTTARSGRSRRVVARLGPVRPLAELRPDSRSPHRGKLARAGRQELRPTLHVGIDTVHDGSRRIVIGLQSDPHLILTGIGQINGMRTFWHSSSTELEISPGRTGSGGAVSVELEKTVAPAVALTREAVAAIQQLVTEHPGAGLKIHLRSVDGQGMQLELEMKEGPGPTDKVIVDRGARVFVDENVVPLLAGKTLDAEVTRDSGLRFRLVS